MTLARRVLAELPEYLSNRVTLLDGGKVVREASKQARPGILVCCWHLSELAPNSLQADSQLAGAGTRWELVWRQGLFVKDGFERAEKMGLR